MEEILDIELPRLKHQHWSLNGMFHFSDGEFLDLSRLQSDYEFDGILAMKTPNIVWADVAYLVRDRDIVLEHFSRSIDWWDFFSSKGKFMGYSREQFRRGTKRPKRAPCLLMISHCYPRNVVKLAGLKPHAIKGVYTSGTDDFDTVILIVTTQLPADSKYNWLRLCSRAPAMDELHLIRERLMKVRDFSKTELEHLTEATMTVQAYSKPTIAELAKEQIRLEFELKEKEEKEAQASRSIAELAKEQIRLEFELKDKEEKASELAKEQIRLEFELKEKEEKASRTIADLAKEQARLKLELEEALRTIEELKQRH